MSDSERSWTVDFASRLEKAGEDAKPFRDKAALLTVEAKTLENSFREKRKAKIHPPEELKQAEDAWKTVEREARKNNAKAQAIEDAAYDLKAVNPNRKTETDTRTPNELLDFIAAKGQEADAALARLRELISQTQS